MSEKDADDMEAAIGEPTTTVKMPARVRKQTEESLQYRREMVEKTVKRCKAQFTKQLKEDLDKQKMATFYSPNVKLS